jgi:glucitol/sorbitol PTS system EIIA component
MQKNLMGECKMSETIITEIGSLVQSFEKEKILILFGPNAPQELREISVIHQFKSDVNDDLLVEDGKLYLGDQEYSITAVGSSANKNLKELGHISIYFSEPSKDILPGAVFVAPYVFPKLKIGEVIRFEK